MCGIAGLLLRDPSRTVEREWLDAMAATLRHRGPDGTGFALDRNVGLANTRLAIIDRVGGAQPMESADGSLCVTFNGEIFNFVELRAELRREGRVFRTASDTEVLLHLYERDGIELLPRLNGMFAFALHDRRRDRVLLARDRLGEKPLYLFEDAERVAFASEIKALLALPTVPREPDPESLQDYLTLQYCLGDRTLFRGIRRLLPGRYLVLDRAGAGAEGRYWELGLEEDEGPSPEDWTAELRRLLEDAVRIRLRSDVPTGLLLSGGLDSTLVAALAAGGRPAFTVSGGEGPAYDEAPYAVAAARAIGLPHLVVRTSPEDVARHLGTIVRHLDEPVAGPAALPLFLLAQLAREHCGVVLGGQGGDEAFAGYGRYGLLAGSAPPAGYEPLAAELERARTGDPVRDYFSLVSRAPRVERYLSPDVAAGHDGAAVFARFAEEFGGGGPLLTRMTAYDVRVGLQSLLHVEDRMTMAHSLEARQPLLDHRIVELAFRVPAEHRLPGGRPKGLLLAAVADLLPREVLDRRDKMGLPVPWVEWARGPAEEFVRDVLLGPRARSRGLVEPRAVEALIREERPYGRALWGLVCLELWFRELIDR